MRNRMKRRYATVNSAAPCGPEQAITFSASLAGMHNVQYRICEGYDPYHSARWSIEELRGSQV